MYFAQQQTPQSSGHIMKSKFPSTAQCLSISIKWRMLWKNSHHYRESYSDPGLGKNWGNTFFSFQILILCYYFFHPSIIKVIIKLKVYFARKCGFKGKIFSMPLHFPLREKIVHKTNDLTRKKNDCIVAIIMIINSTYAILIKQNHIAIVSLHT